MKILFVIAGLVAASIVPVRGATLDAAAGLGGLAKAGRWTPLTVSIASDRDVLDAELVVVWGDARLQRPVTLSPGSRKTFELYLRTTDPRGAIDVRLQSDGRDLARARLRWGGVSGHTLSVLGHSDTPHLSGAQRILVTDSQARHTGRGPDRVA